MISIDSVGIGLFDYELDDDHNIIHRGDDDTQNNYWKWKNASTAGYCNVPGKFYLNQTADQNIFVHCSLPRLMNGHNVYPLDHGQHETALDMLTDELKQNGIHCDVKNDGKLFRVDVFTQEQMPDANKYIQSLESIEIPRHPGELHASGSTMLWKNKSSAFTMYNKTDEAFSQIKKMGEGYRRLLENLPVPPDLVRAESRLMKSAKVADVLSSNVVYSICVDTGMSLLADHHDRFLNRLKNATPSKPGAFSWRAEMRRFKESGKQNWLAQFRMHLGDQLIQRMVSVDQIKHYAVNELGIKPANLQRWLADLRKES